MTLREGEVAETVEVEEAVSVDVDDDGRPPGQEFLSGGDLLPFLVGRGGEFAVPARLDTAADAESLRATTSPTRSADADPTTIAGRAGMPE